MVRVLFKLTSGLICKMCQFFVDGSSLRNRQKILSGREAEVRSHQIVMAFGFAEEEIIQTAN